MKELSESTVRALGALHLLMQAKRPLSTPTLARRVKAPVRLLHGILSKLALAGLVQGRVGRGFVLARAPGEIRLEDIIHAMEEPAKPSAPCGGNFDACPTRASCVLSVLCRKADESFTEAMRTFTLEDLRELTPDVPNCMDPAVRSLTRTKNGSARKQAK